MAYFPDLSPHTYTKFGNALNVGWLERGYDYQTGTVTPEFMNLLGRYYGVQQPFGFLGFHVCDLCSDVMAHFQERHTPSLEAEDPADMAQPKSLNEIAEKLWADRHGNGEIYVFGSDYSL